MSDGCTVTAQIWLWTSVAQPTGWHFLTIDGQSADDLRAAALMHRMAGGPRRGWGSLCVRAGIGATAWDMSVFPHKESSGWLLPVKAAVRRAEGLAAGDVVTVRVDLI